MGRYHEGDARLPTFRRPLEGEIIRTFDGDLEVKPAYGAGRLWQTQTQGEELAQIIERSGVPALLQQVKGWRGSVLVQLQDGRIGTFSALNSAPQPMVLR